VASGIRREFDAAGPDGGRERGDEGSPGTGRIVGPAGPLWKTGGVVPVWAGPGGSLGQSVSKLTYPWYVAYSWSVIHENDRPMEVERPTF
jgi:hypothetical protein